MPVVIKTDPHKMSASGVLNGEQYEFYMSGDCSTQEPLIELFCWLARWPENDKVATKTPGRGDIISSVQSALRGTARAISILLGATPGCHCEGCEIQYDIAIDVIMRELKERNIPIPKI
jgi:hypothetical protein